MILSRILKTKYLRRVSMLVFVSSLAACSGGDGGLAGTGIISLGELDLNWTVPGSREDGTPLLGTEISGYRIYYGTAKGDYQQQIDVDSSFNVVQVPDVPVGTYYAVVTAVDTEGRESLYSSEVEVIVL